MKTVGSTNYIHGTFINEGKISSPQEDWENDNPKFEVIDPVEPKCKKCGYILRPQDDQCQKCKYAKLPPQWDRDFDREFLGEIQVWEHDNHGSYQTECRSDIKRFIRQTLLSHEQKIREECHKDFQNWKRAYMTGNYQEKEE